MTAGRIAQPYPHPSPKPQATPANSRARLAKAAAPLTSAPSDESSWLLADANGKFASVQTIAQGATRAGAALLHNNKAVTFTADVLDGKGTEVEEAITAFARGASSLVSRLSPDLAGKVVPAIFKAEDTLCDGMRSVGEAAPIFNILSATYDTLRAIREQRPDKRRAAWATACLSIVGTGLALGAATLAGTPAGWGLGAGAAATCSFQLLDSVAFGGKASQWLGDHVVGPIASAAQHVWHAVG
ncbi:MAG TPA: hypothetical protein V6D47_11815 [Oscillatoriaceae cyanobacterium]